MTLPARLIQQPMQIRAGLAELADMTKIIIAQRCELGYGLRSD